jgi:hypothetical protein
VNGRTGQIMRPRRRTLNGACCPFRAALVVVLLFQISHSLLVSSKRICCMPAVALAYPLQGTGPLLLPQAPSTPCWLVVGATVADEPFIGWQGDSYRPKLPLEPDEVWEEQQPDSNCLYLHVCFPSNRHKARILPMSTCLCKKLSAVTGCRVG